MDNASNIRNRAWQATWEGRYNDALAIYDVDLAEELSQYPDTRPHTHVSNRATLLILMGRLGAALEMLRQSRLLQKEKAGAYPVPMIGAVLWMLGEYKEACNDWVYEISRRDDGLITHCDEAGGVQVPALLWWAAAHTGLEGYRKIAGRQLKKRGRTKRCQHSRWPGPLVPYLLGQGSEPQPSDSALLEAASNYSERYPKINFRYLCQAHFYLGASCLIENDSKTYLWHMKQVVAAKSPPSVSGKPPMLNGVDALRLCDAEYHLARTILQNTKDVL